MTADDIEKLAREYRDSCADTGNTGCIGDDIARALVAVLPVVRAAESWSEFAQKHPYGARGDDELEDAIDQMRREMEGL